MSDGNGHIVRSAKLVGRRGATPHAVMWLAMGVALGLFAIYIGAIHAYSMARLRPLIAGLPRSSERITLRDGYARYAARMSNRLLGLMGFGAVMMLIGNALRVTDMLLSHRPIDTLSVGIGVTSTILVTGQFTWLVILRLRQKRQATV